MVKIQKVYILLTLLVLISACSRMNYHLPKGPVNTLELKDGTYIGEAKWTPVYVKAEVTIKDNAILDIVILKHRHGPSKSFSGQEVIPKIMETQSTQVDVVSGATISSRVITSAVQDAVNKAGVSPLSR